MEGWLPRKGVGSSEGMKATNLAGQKYFRCLGTSHHQSNCTREPVCYKCKLKGHMAVDCKAFWGKKLQMFGFGIPGQGFYSINIPETKVKEAAAIGIITVLEGDALVEKLDKELKNLAQGD